MMIPSYDSADACNSRETNNSKRTSAKAGVRAVVETKGTSLKTRAAGMLLTKEMLSEVGTPATAWKYQNSGGIVMCDIVPWDVLSPVILSRVVSSCGTLFSSTIIRFRSPSIELPIYPDQKFFSSASLEFSKVGSLQICSANCKSANFQTQIIS